MQSKTSWLCETICYSALKSTSKWEVQIAAEATGDLIINTIAVKITEIPPWSALEAASEMKNK